MRSELCTLQSVVRTHTLFMHHAHIHECPLYATQDIRTS